uniref:Pre-mRNA polyadenylation factor Fip1 domain-containing protein n=1 Tax=Entomoneis paludosa TaxID=265537 RepID=A0A7S2VBV6_9STRA|mmetsp:Transcript_15330/g.31642  ORF Transcript_15330/g.31642 Transcript_15330/m.31642 type:complete len:537 (+) Transcript_15330:446-2056(+)|eukprot:CAMPEP_0172451788 /NCGR_PEP_ID=MMETSP1065-20121228/9672_1 /TAXON_ID=265537 /ORGANISM="Amphiprora paludosa, Strain CCMP125" /LENGTH=536 /DNA_ID=CAMNT_0013203759 /DNA_START=430 /DNA_END=2040 /DNA_ORIENTATION=-
MGRKKRKTVVEEDVVVKQEDDAPVAEAVSDPEKLSNEGAVNNKKEEEDGGKSSKYAMTSHSGEIVREDIYISDGSEDEEEDVDVVLAASRSGMMRKGLATPAHAMIQPNRQWVRPDANTGAAVDESVAEKQREEELAQLDPVQRAARLQAEKARLEQEEKQQERLQESQENAGRDPTLFSKRTAFDIRFDQMEDKPWLRAADISDFFNYGLDEEGWLEYAQQQLTIRQELTDAARSKRGPDPNVVPVTPKAPSSQAPRVAVVGGASSTNSDGEEDPNASDKEEEVNTAPLGPSLPSDGVVPKSSAYAGDTAPASEPAAEEVDVGIGGAWGAGAVPGSHLARLIEEQEKKESGGHVNRMEDDSGHYEEGGGPPARNDPYGAEQDYGSGGGGAPAGGESDHYGGGGGRRSGHDQYNNNHSRGDEPYGRSDYGASDGGHYGSHYGGADGGGGGYYGGDQGQDYDQSGGGGNQWQGGGGGYDDQYGGGGGGSRGGGYNRRGGYGRGGYGGGGRGGRGGYNNNNSWDQGRDDYNRKRSRNY